MRKKILIQAGKSDRHYWRDLWDYRDLFYFLVWRDILVRYKQTVIGIAWAVIRPVLTMVVLSVVFGKIAKLPSEGVPYPILVFSAMLPWQFFATAVEASSNSLVSNANLISKVYFPRLIVPTSAIIVTFLDFLIAGVILVSMMVWYDFSISWRVVFLPGFIILAFMASIGLGLWFSSLNVQYRDIRYVIPFLVQVGLYASPVAYSSSLVPEHWRLLYSINPMVGVIDGFRWAILGGQASLYIPGLIMSIGLVIILLVSGIWYFRRAERRFADVI